MDVSTSGIIKLLLPRTPLILKTILLSRLSLSQNASKQETTTEVVVAILRSFLKVKKPIGYIQHVSYKDPGIKGPIWVAKATLPAPDDGARKALVRAIQELGDGRETYSLPETLPVEGEWTGHRSGVGKDAVLPEVSEEEKYSFLMKDAESPITILYFHGGAYMAMDPSSHRKTTLHLAKKTKGVCFSVRYRLAPQHPFPAQILDALVAFLSLLSPPPGSFHQPVAASNIIFSGDSAGGNLSLVLLQTLMTLQRCGVKSIPFHGSDVPLQLPAGVALNSPWCDIAASMPSWRRNLRYDYLEGPVSPGVPDESLPDKVWPTQPPRVLVYCNGSVLGHPLVSPLAASSELWKGMPPAFICFGNECLEDEIRVTARRMYEGGGKVAVAGYEGMPHCFAMLFAKSAMGKDCLDAWTKFIVDAVEGKVERVDSWKWMKAFSKTGDDVPLSEMSPLTDEEVRRSMTEAKAGTIAKEEILRAEFETKKSKPHL